MASAQAEVTLVGPGARADETAVAVPRQSRRRRLEIGLFVLPAVLFQLCWGWYPLVAAFLLSFTNARVRSPIAFTGLDSYLRMWHDPLAIQAFRVTALYAGLTILLTFVVPIIVAILLMEMPRHVIRWMMLLWFIPLSVLASTLVFRYMYNTQYGIFQWVATDILHLPPQPFLNSAAQVNFWIVFPGLLFFGPGLIYIATLQGIPRSYYEAAEIEGAEFLAEGLDDLDPAAASRHLDAAHLLDHRQRASLRAATDHDRRRPGRGEPDGRPLSLHLAAGAPVRRCHRPRCLPLPGGDGDRRHLPALLQ